MFLGEPNFALFFLNGYFIHLHFKCLSFARLNFFLIDTMK